jgi:DinB family protein
MAPITPYTHNLGGRDPLQAIPDSARTIDALTRDWTPHDFERRYAPGKWTARQVIIHLAQTELALGARSRMALSTPNYAAQSFDQDAWMTRETTLSGTDATHALLAMMRMNLALFTALSDNDREAPLSHPEYGALTVDWIIHQMAGHHIHHLRQLQQL